MQDTLLSKNLHQSKFGKYFDAYVDVLGEAISDVLHLILISIIDASCIYFMNLITTFYTLKM